jgi:hypothetical protein
MSLIQPMVLALLNSKHKGLKVHPLASLFIHFTRVLIGNRFGLDDSFLIHLNV